MHRSSPPRSSRGIAFAATLLATTFPSAAYAQTVEASLSPVAWIATDSMRSVTFLGRPALWIDRGVALLRGASLENGTLEMDLAVDDHSSFAGIAFRAANPRFSNVVFLRPGSSGTEEAVQYGPAMNALGVAWQVYHGAGANAVAEVPRNRWIHVKLELDGAVARLFVDTATAPTLVVPRVVASGGNGFGIWTGAFGRGGYVSALHFTPAPTKSMATATAAAPAGTISHWQLSDVVEPAAFTPAVLPDLNRLHWDPVEPEPEGWVLVNRYRDAPQSCGTPADSNRVVLADSVMTGRFAGTRVVYARTMITAAADETRQLEYSYNNGIVIYLNGRPLVLAMNPSGLRSSLGVMAHTGDAVYLPLRKGQNDLVFAVIDCTGGWAYSARLGMN
jgi:hypothetical protein